MTEAGREEDVIPVLGIVGALASGKSTVAAMLAERGARVIDADRIGHLVLERSAIRDALARRFGEAILDARGRVSRRRLAELAFEDAGEVEKLNAIVHPPILEEIRDRVREAKAAGEAPLIVLDAALLMETDLHRELCTALLFVEAPEQARLQRATSRRGLSEEQFRKRQQAQLPEQVKRRSADYVVVNSGSRDELRSRLERLWPELCRMNRAVSN